MIHFRSFRNGDPPALVDLWNRALPDGGAVRPLNVHEFDALALGKLHFEADGLIVAELDGRVLGFAHAGFGPIDPDGAAHRLDTSLGTVAMLVTEPEIDDPELELGLFLAAERYLRSRGASVFYAGGQWPLNPFYWGIYGGSEFSGILDSHADFRRAAARAGYEPSATTIVMEADLSEPETRDPRGLLMRRQFRLEAVEDAIPRGWWHALALGLFRPTAFSLVDKMTGRSVASAWSWDIAACTGLGDGRVALGLIDVEVQPDQRRRGYGRHLVAEILRHARARSTDVVSVQTPATNLPALGLYRSAGFVQIDVATMYRLPGVLSARST